MRRISKRLSQGWGRRASDVHAHPEVRGHKYDQYSSGSDGSSSYFSDHSRDAARSTSDQQNWSKKEECPLCHESFFGDMCMTPCGHKFCRSCIEKSLRSPEKVCEICNVVLSDYTVVWCSNQEPLKTRDVSNIFGSVFIQFGTIGLESYHFDHDKCYVRYDHHVIPKRWTLDNGQPPPRKKFFVDWHFDKRNNFFKGTIDWAPNTFRRRTKCVYEMEFDEGFEQIVGGRVTIHTVDGKTKVQTFGNDKLKNLHYRRLMNHIYGNSYIRLPSPQESPDAQHIVSNLGNLGHSGLGIPRESVELMVWQELPLDNLGNFSLHFSRQSSYIDLSAISGPHPPRVHFYNAFFDQQTRVFTGKLDGRDCPHLLPPNSEWKLKFNETLEKIDRGKIKHYNENGQIIKEKEIGWKGSSGQRYILIAPWQSTDNSNDKLKDLENLLTRA